MSEIRSQEAGPLIDAHCHLGNGPAGALTARQLIERLDQNAVALAIVSPGRVDESSEIPAANDLIVSAVHAYPERLIGFALTDPTAQADAPAELARALDAGLVGLKLRPGVAGLASAQHTLRAVVELAARRRAPVYFHSGTQIMSVARDAVQLASQFSDLPFVLSYRKGPTFEKLPTETIPENLYFDTSTLAPQQVADLLRHVGAGRIVFGSGFPFGSQRIEMSKAFHSVPAEDVPLVFGGNIRAILARCGIRIPV